MWYTGPMTKTPNIEKALDQAQRTVLYARSVREHHRRRSVRGNRQREADITIALERLKRAMRPLRVYMGIACHREVDEALLALAKDVSRQMQSERRKLWKMQNR